jgi:hypothetical protein
MTKALQKEVDTLDENYLLLKGQGRLVLKDDPYMTSSHTKASHAPIAV